MKKVLFILGLSVMLAAVSVEASAQAKEQSLAGRYKAYDEKSNKPSLLVEVYETKKGVYSARVLETLSGTDAVCRTCKGDRRNKPVKGMVIMWNLAAQADGTFAGGTLLKPANGKTYKVKAKVQGGKILIDYGCLSVICVGKWTREP